MTTFHVGRTITVSNETVDRGIALGVGGGAILITSSRARYRLHRSRGLC